MTNRVYGTACTRRRRSEPYPGVLEQSGGDHALLNTRSETSVGVLTPMGDRRTTPGRRVASN
jgi:hypothetical protein